MSDTDAPTPAEPEQPAVSPDAGEPAAIEQPAAEPAAVAVAAPESTEADPLARFVAPPEYSARKPLWTLGRRKSSSARVRTFPGGGNFMVNGRPLDEYFVQLKDRHHATAALDRANVRKDYDVWVNVHGGGTTGQAGAVALGVARAVIQLVPSAERSLRDAGLLSRDARIKERKKYGRRGARRGFQFSKR